MIDRSTFARFWLRARHLRAVVCFTKGGLIQRQRQNWGGGGRIGGHERRVEGFQLHAAGIGGAIETSALFLVKRIRALIAGTSPDIMLIAYRSSIFMPPPAAGTERRAGGRETRRMARNLWRRSAGGEGRTERVHNIDRVPLGRVELASAIGSYQTARRLVDTGALIAAPVFILPAKLIIVASGSE